MRNAKIRLAYRVIIDNSSTSLWEKYIFEDTFKEYLMQHQLFNPKENLKRTYRELVHENEKSIQLNYLVGIAAGAYVQQLKNVLYKVCDVLGKTFFPFTNYQLDIINTDIDDIRKHKIGITFYSPMLTLVDILNNGYLVSLETDEKNGYETIMFPVQPNLAISYYENSAKKQEGN